MVILFTLRTIRESCCTIDEISEHCGITVSDYKVIESNPGQAQLSLITKMSNLLGVPLNIIFPGTENDFTGYNRSRLDHILSTKTTF